MKTAGLNIMIVTPHFPYPLIGGERIKLYNLINHLSKKNKVFLISMDRGYEVKKEFVDIINEMGVDVFVYKINKFSSTIASGFFSLFRYPLEVEYFRNSAFNQKINELFKNHDIDLVINFFIRTAEHVKNIKRKKILIAEDCRSYYQKRTSKISKNIRQKLVRFYDAKKLAKYEAGIMNYFDRTTVVTNEDYNQMHRLNPHADIKIISIGVNSDIFFPIINAKQRKDILFLGKLDVWANILMIKRIVNEIFPLIKKIIPDARLNIVGSNPIKEIMAFQDDSIYIHKNPDNIINYYQHAAVFLHPHLGGSGIQNKVLESMSTACPVVTTKSGANGIEINNAVNGYIADSNEEFVNLTCELLINSKLREEIGMNARNYIIKNKSWESVFSAWDRMIEEL